VKVCHLGWSFTVGGAETMLLDIMREQCRYASVHLIIVNDKVDQKLLEEVHKDIKIHLVRRRPGSRDPHAILKLNGIILRNKFDVIHSHSEELIRAIFIDRNKAAITIHDVGQSIRELKLYGKLFAISQAVRQDVYERSGLLPRIVYNGINCQKVKIREYSPYSSDQEFRLVQVSRLYHEKKGQHILLEALSILARSFGMNKVTVDFIGEGPSFGYLSRMTHELGVSDRVRFLGLMDRNEIFSKLCGYHALLQPSFYEGFGNTVIEGMAAKIPVVVSGIQGPMEIIENGRYGYYFKIGDATDCAEKIKLLVEQYNSAQTVEMLEGAWKRVNRDFDIRVTARNYCEGYL
jgi:glycosyltransferase involved in cell wall biosynthesis